MPWELVWRVVDGPSGPQERNEAFAIAGETIEFEIHNTIAAENTAAQRSRYWRQRLRLFVSGQRRVGPIVATDRSPTVVRYRFNYPGPKTLELSGTPAPPTRPAMSGPSGRPVSQDHPEIEPVAFTQRFMVSPASDPGARRPPPGGQVAATAQGMTSPTARAAQEGAREEARIRRQLNDALWARRAQVRALRAQRVETRDGSLDSGGWIPIDLPTRYQIEHEMQDAEVAAFTELLDDMLAVTTPLNLGDRTEPVLDREGGAPILAQVIWEITPEDNRVRFVETGRAGGQPYRTGRELLYQNDDLLYVRIPTRDQPALVNAGGVGAMIADDSTTQIIHFAVFELIMIAFPVDALIGEVLMALMSRVATPAVRALIRLGERALGAATPEVALERRALLGQAGRRGARQLTSMGARGIADRGLGQAERGLLGSASSSSAPGGPGAFRALRREWALFLTESHRLAVQHMRWARLANLPRGALDPEARNAFRDWAINRILSQPGHPLLPLLDEQTGDFIGTRLLRRIELVDTPTVQMGHVTSRFAGDEERFALQWAWTNQIEGTMLERRGSVVMRQAVEIGDVPVEIDTALMWEREGLLPQGTVANARASNGWSWNEWTSLSTGIRGVTRWVPNPPLAP